MKLAFSLCPSFNPNSENLSEVLITDQVRVQQFFDCFRVLLGVDAGHFVVDSGAVREKIHDLLQMTDLPVYTLAS